MIHLTVEIEIIYQVCAELESDTPDGFESSSVDLRGRWLSQHVQISEIHVIFFELYVE